MIHPFRARRCRPLAGCAGLAVLLLVAVSQLGITPLLGREIAPNRLTPVVRAVRDARPAVVNIQGQKFVSSAVQAVGEPDAPHQVNGMGTGTIIDERGYILTNYHVVADVRRIEVTLDDGRSYTGELIARDKTTDLAIIKIAPEKPLPVIRIGTSFDLMDGEPVIALGNAFGYQHTITRGIVSALGRDVQVSETQSYDDLIQTDASINPGNSGGPLLNIEGEMIGVNVAVRAGAQGIGFAIPVDIAMQVAAELMSVQSLQNKWHGLETCEADEVGDPLVVTGVKRSSPAADSGLQPGDEILRVGSLSVVRPLDLERALLDRVTGEEVPIEILREGRTLDLHIALAAAPSGATGSDEDALETSDAWQVLGLDLIEEPRRTFQRRGSRYRGGMRVVAVRPDSPAAAEGILAGDILVGMQRWETASRDDIRYIVSRPDLADMGPIKFYVLRGRNTLYGHINVAAADSSQRATRR